MQDVVCDAGPILHLHEAGLLRLLRNCGRTRVPRLVHTEIVSASPEIGRAWPSWIEVRQLSAGQRKWAGVLTHFGDLHRGEAEAYVLARTTRGAWLLTDAAAARLFASTMGIEVHGTLGVVLWNVAQGHVDGKGGLAALDALANTSLWVSDSILDEARETVIGMT
jgi:predicted nucleic acid-binding protein